MKNYTPVYKYPLKDDDGWKKLTGELPVKMTNDYLFRALMQSENDVLKAIIASALHRNVEEITSAEVTNPILLGESIDNKTYILDIHVDLNKSECLDLEMQVIHEMDWTERSLSYICRSFDQLNKGRPYKDAKPVRQIAFCDFTLFKDSPEFCATYQFLNIRKPKVVYSDKIIIINIDLTRWDLADAEDKEYRLDKWAKLFKAETWEELKMLAEKDVIMEKAISASWQMTEEEMIREQCRAREDWIINNEYKDRLIAQQQNEIAQQQDEIAQQQDEIAQQQDEIANLKGVNINLMDVNIGLKDENAGLKDENSGLKDENSGLKDENTGLKDENSALRQLLMANGISVPSTEK